MLQCSVGICIPKRYTCDGVIDCHNGEDESPTHCGPGNPCDNKLMCPDNRCIPFSWCCELHRESNCTTKNKPMCCSHVEKLSKYITNLSENRKIYFVTGVEVANIIFLEFIFMWL